MSRPTPQDEERIIFFLMIECLCQQVEMLQPTEKESSKAWLNNLIHVARKTSDDLREHMTEETIAQFEDMYDYIYMTIRRAAQVHNPDIEEFNTMIKDWLKKKYGDSDEVSMFTINPTINDQTQQKAD